MVVGEARGNHYDSLSYWIVLSPPEGKPLHKVNQASLQPGHYTGLTAERKAGTRMADAGVTLTAVSEILGHADIRTTMRYAHATDEAKRRAVRALEDKSYESLSTNRPQEKRAAG